MTRIDTPADLPPAITEYLRRFVYRRRKVSALRACAAAILVALIWLLSWSVVDRILVTPGFARAAMSLTLIVVMITMVKMPLAALFRRNIDWREAAEQLEDRDPRFNEMLVTIVSQSLTDRQSRASQELMARLVEAAESRISVIDSRLAAPRTPALATALAAMIVGCGVAALCAWSWLGLPQLLLRQILPLGSIPPVTSTRLVVQASADQVLQGDALTITIHANQLPGSTVLLQTTIDGTNWSNIEMLPSSDGRFVYKFNAVSRDFDYRIRAGDAAAGLFHVRVARKPVVKEFLIRLDYPDYIKKAPLEISNTNGEIVAPAGTRAEVTILASEPLKSASALIDGQRVELTRTADPSRFVTKIDVLNDTQWNLEIVSEMQVVGAAPANMPIRAVGDRPPAVRLTAPLPACFAGVGEVLHLPVQTADDFAVSIVLAHVAIDGVKAIDIPMSVEGNLRQFEQQLSLNLGEYGATIGQLITISVTATDGSGQSTTSDVYPILVSSKTIDPVELLQLKKLNAAVQLSNQIVSHIQEARSSINNRVTLATRVEAASEATSELVELISQISLRNTQDRRRSLFTELIDLARQQASSLENATPRLAVESAENLSNQFDHMQRAAEAITSRLSLFRGGVAADVIIAELENMVAFRNRTDPVFARVYAEIELTISQLGLQPDAANLDDELHRLSSEAEKLMHAAHTSENKPNLTVEKADMGAQTAEGSLPIEADVAAADPEILLDAAARSRALKIVRTMQDELTNLPQQLARVEQLADDARSLRETSLEAARDVHAAKDGTRTTLIEEASAAQADYTQALQALAGAAQSVGLDAIAGLTNDLRTLSTDFSKTVAVLDKRLQPALQQLITRMVNGDVDAIRRATAQVRDAAVVSQDTLRATHQWLMERDPVVGAQRFSKEAWHDATIDGLSPGLNQSEVQDALRAYFKALGASSRPAP